MDPAILTVVETKLGLRLEKRTLPFNVLVVDHVEKADFDTLIWAHSIL